MTGTEKRLVPPSTGERRGLTHLEIGHMVLQQSLCIADVLFSSHKHEGNHALIKHKEGEIDEELSVILRKQTIVTLNTESHCWRDIIGLETA